MIRPEGFAGAAFGLATDGDGRSDETARDALSAELGISSDWAIVRQVHGAQAVVVSEAGPAGDADAIVTVTQGLPIAVATADCLPVILEGDGGVAIAHAGWRGAAGGVVRAAREMLASLGVAATRAAVGPGIGPCCFEVGDEVAAQFPQDRSQTRWGTTSVDLAAAVSRELEGLTVWASDACTHCGTGYHSFRRDGTSERQVAVAWLPV